MKGALRRRSFGNSVQGEQHELMRCLALVPIRLYQRLLSPLLPSSCRFQPSCSQYAVEAIERFGLARGGGLAVARILRCHPFNPGGFDPVPYKD